MRYCFCFLIILLGVIGAANCYAQEVDKDATASNVEKWIIVMRDPRSMHRKSRSAEFIYSPSQAYHEDPKLKSVSRKLAKDYQLTILSQWPIKSINVHCLVATFPENQDSASVLEKINADARVESVQPMNEFDALGKPDPYQSLQASLVQLGVEETHKYVTGMGISVAIIDSGIDTDHPDLSGVITWQENFVDDVPMHAEQHGTGIAGIIAARSDNGVGITGVAPDVKVYGLRACWQDDANSSKARCNTLTLARALDRVIETRPIILNLSLSGPSDPLLERLLTRVISQNTIVVAAYDEIRNMNDRFPRSQNGVFYGRSGAHHYETQSSNCLPAPAHDVLTLQPQRTYDVLSGNSLAAAHISGAIALLLEANPNLEINQIQTALRASVKHHSDTVSINACKALRTINNQVECKDAL